MKCPNCQTAEAQVDKVFGVLPCSQCQTRQTRLSTPSPLPEFTSEEIKQQRKEHYTDTLPWHRKGQLDKGAVDRYGKQAAIDRGFSEKEIEKAEYVWENGDDPANSYYKKH